MIRKSAFLLLLSLAVAVSALADLTPSQITNISCAQRWPWNGKVDINYTLSSSAAYPVFRVAFYGQIGNGEEFALNTLEGDGACGVTFEDGVKRVTWDASIDKPNTESSNVKVGIIALDVTVAAKYLVLDLNNYTMSYTMAGPDLSNDNPSRDAYKSWKVYFKRIDPGTYYMGSDPSEPGREPATNPTVYEDKHEVTITKPFYIGVFECTAAQYAIVTDSSSSAKTPQVQVNMADLRGTAYGATWPTYTDHRVDDTSFFGKLRQKTGYSLKFDLPTEAQWEMAARDKGDGTYQNDGTYNYDGTFHGDKVWNDGSTFWKTVVVEDPQDPERSYTTNIVDYSDLANLGWFRDPNSALHDVGLKNPGINGLYDIHGNAWEYCLDRLAVHLGTSAETDPVGNSSGSSFIVKSGSVYVSDPTNYCRMAMRMGRNARTDNIGFRIAIVF
ncbi:SUMF1/EgtB/PvdO family nonheme iron enzyme [bacterium]|nr:SUMF1/EgtB/PvdO family nonheme iron enzyme [bacterium]